MDRTREFLYKILDAVDYTDDKEIFAAQFLENIRVKALMELVKSLPAEKRGEARKKLIEGSVDPQKAATVIQAYFTETQIQEALKNTAQSMMVKYIESIEDVLSPAQKENLIKIFGNLRSAV